MWVGIGDFDLRLLQSVDSVWQSHGPMEWNAMQCNAMQWTGVEWSGMEWNGVELHKVLWFLMCFSIMRL